MPLVDQHDPRPVHFVGVAGAGMSALAELLHRRGVTVTGCDQHVSGAADIMALGVAVAQGHDAGHVQGARALVVSSAIPKEHPELVAARVLGIPVIRRAEALAEATAGGRLVGIAGTHGKSTTTVMTTEALASAGFDPTGVVGGRVGSWNGNLRRGTSDVFVVEADEYDRSFLALDPFVAVVTNLEADHLDIYRDLDDLRGAFEQYIRGARYLVLCADDPGADALPSPPTAEVVRYGIQSANARLVARDLRSNGTGTSFDVWYDGTLRGTVALQVPGEHNVRNALAALAVGLLWGKSVDEMAPGLASFGGVERRFQRIGESAGVAVVDDYAHHPTEIRATIAAARDTFVGRRIVVAFQPHLYSRTRDFADEFGLALAAADAVYLADIYPAREQPIDGVSSDLIAEPLRQGGGHLCWQGPRTALAAALADGVSSGDVVITVGAGDITKTGPELLAILRTPA
jgi:UDP-N-acetylmuramate--alanine ligase